MDTKKVAIVVLVIMLFGFILPSIYQAVFPIEPILKENYRRADERMSSLFLAAHVIDNYDQYPDTCTNRQLSQVLIQTYTWMMIPGPVVEACVSTTPQGGIEGIKSVGLTSS